MANKYQLVTKNRPYGVASSDPGIWGGWARHSVSAFNDAGLVGGDNNLSSEVARDLAVGWRVLGYRVSIHPAVRNPQPEEGWQFWFEKAERQEIVDPKDHVSDSLDKWVPGRWMAPFGDRPASRQEKNWSHMRYWQALLDGKVDRAFVCARCGYDDQGTVFSLAVDENAVHAHHEDYSKPLDVIYLCASCHSCRHSDQAANPMPIQQWVDLGVPQ